MRVGGSDPIWATTVVLSPQILYLKLLGLPERTSSTTSVMGALAIRMDSVGRPTTCTVRAAIIGRAGISNYPGFSRSKPGSR
jgi:hypothetical protein